MPLQDLQLKDALQPAGYLDVLYYYARVAPLLRTFLKGKSLATKIHLPKGNIPFFLRRATTDGLLKVDDLLTDVDLNLLKLRINALADVRGQLTEKQQRIWSYFVPRKFIDFFYATNGESAGASLERLFFDIDRKGVDPDIAQQVTAALLDVIAHDTQFRDIVGSFKFYVQWTGASFHVYLLLNKTLPASFYERFISYSKTDPLRSFTGRWVAHLAKEVYPKTQAGHEKKEGWITIDPSQSPSGKLARCPFSLHVNSPGGFDGIALPVDIKRLSDKTLIKDLQSFTPKKVLDNLDHFKQFLP
ncbi:hypothetical protein J4208_01905 [Candidatus Woesearchaeota archaeon]|nr:hypothetical protein [Candidatus Woesearchaeota archaeon]